MSFPDVNALDDFSSNRITRILTTDFPQYFAIISRVRQEVHAIGPEGGILSSTVVPQVQAIFPEGALTKKIKVGLQVGDNLDTNESKAKAKQNRFSRFFRRLFRLSSKEPNQETVDSAAATTTAADESGTQTKTTETTIESAPVAKPETIEPEISEPDEPVLISKKVIETQTSQGKQLTAPKSDQKRHSFEMWVLINSKNSSRKQSKDDDHLVADGLKVEPQNTYRIDESQSESPLTPRKNSIFHIVNIRPAKMQLEADNQANLGQPTQAVNGDVKHSKAPSKQEKSSKPKKATKPKRSQPARPRRTLGSVVVAMFPKVNLLTQI